MNNSQKSLAARWIGKMKRLGKSAFFKMIGSTFSFLHASDFCFGIPDGQVPTTFRINAYTDQIAIQFSYDVPDHMLDCYIFPVIDGKVDEEFVGPTGFYWELISYCQSVLRMDRQICKTIVQKTSSIVDPFERTMAMYLRFLREVDLNDLGKSKFRKRRPRK